METPPRILRAMAMNRDRVPRFVNQKERDRHERILHVAQGVFADAGFTNVTFRGMAISLRMASATLRYHFADLEALLAEILRRHLRRLSAELAKVPRDAPNRQRCCRDAYLAYTRVGAGGLSEPHHLLVSYGHLLPPDERITIEQMRNAIADTLGGQLGHEALLFLDSPIMNARRVNAALMGVDSADTEVIAEQTALPPPQDPPPPELPAPAQIQPPRPAHATLTSRDTELDPPLAAMVLALARSTTPKPRPPPPDPAQRPRTHPANTNAPGG